MGPVFPTRFPRVSPRTCVKTFLETRENCRMLAIILTSKIVEEMEFSSVPPSQKFRKKLILRCFDLFDRKVPSKFKMSQHVSLPALPSRQIDKSCSIAQDNLLGLLTTPELLALSLASLLSHASPSSVTLNQGPYGGDLKQKPCLCHHATCSTPGRSLLL